MGVDYLKLGFGDRVLIADKVFMGVCDSFSLINDEFDIERTQKEWKQIFKQYLPLDIIEVNEKVLRSIFDINLKDFKRFWVIENTTTNNSLLYKIDINKRATLPFITK